MYIVMEFYTGPDLFDYIIDNRPVSEEKAAFILEQIARATNFLHTEGGMHRDLKPENFMFQTCFILLNIFAFKWHFSGQHNK
mmetsp:Transcript_21865/g.18157  ORF Transcript_21865/g.18157 Transcript_21865/m.18157 type:complete len:82 (-) Transcript_21865:160-405(-)